MAIDPTAQRPDSRGCGNQAVKKMRVIPLVAGCLLCCCLFAQVPDSISRYSGIIKQHVYNDYKGMFRPAKGTLPYPFITPGSDQYANDLWDWDSWWSNIALRQILTDRGSEKDKKEAVA